MNDLVMGILIVGLLSSLLLVAMLRLSRVLTDRLSNLLAIFVIAMMLTYDLLIEDNIALTHVLPFSNAIVLANWVPLFVAALAGLIWRRVPGRWLRRAIVIGSLAIVCLIATYRPILISPPKMNDKWDETQRVCLQTSGASCSPAAAVTLLKSYGISTNEQEMALLCLTSTRGTSMLGLWRGLKLKTAETGLDVYMFNNGTIDDLRGMGPALISVELEAGASVDPRYQSLLGWLPGVPHTVVVLRFLPSGRALVADPAVGLEPWDLKDLHVLWHGVGARLVRNKS